MKELLKHTIKVVILSLILVFNYISCSNKLPPPLNSDTYVIAHRGVHNEFPENTISAYKAAIELGCDFIEIDVRRTADGKFVSVHNSTVDAYTYDTSGMVSEFTLDELKKLRIGKKKNFNGLNERIPTLEEVLELCKDRINIYLDVKEPHIEDILSVIREYQMEENIVWYIPAREIGLLKQLKVLCPLCIPMPDPGSKENIENIYAEIKPILIATDMDELSQEFIDIAHSNKMKVFVDEEEGNEKEWKKMLEWGVDGIQTDNPQKLIEFLNAER